MRASFICALLVASIGGLAFAAGPAIPDEFKDPDTGARMLHLSRTANDASTVIYFTQPCITPDSRYVIVRYQDDPSGHTAGFLYRFDLQTQEFVKLTDRVTRFQVLDPGSGNIYYSSDKENAIYVTNIMTKETHKFADMPEGLLVYAGLTVNRDQTQVVGVAALHSEQDKLPALTAAPNKNNNLADTFNRHETNILFSFDIKTGKYRELQKINTWLGHVQFSAADAGLLMYCHEGPWDKVDRMWTLNTATGGDGKLVYKPAAGEIVGHEFWSTDGKAVWFDDEFRDGSGKRFLASKNVETGELIKLPQSPEMYSLHYTPSPDGKFFVADGTARKADPASQAMYILTPTIDKTSPEKSTLAAVKLCNMAKNDYGIAEPNPHITLDQHWVVFTATLHGTPQAYAVEMPKAYWR